MFWIFFAVPRQIENLLGLRDRQTLRLVTPQRRIKGDFELIPWRSIRQFPSQLDPFSVVRTKYCGPTEELVVDRGANLLWLRFLSRSLLDARTLFVFVYLWWWNPPP